VQFATVQGFKVQNGVIFPSITWLTKLNPALHSVQPPVMQFRQLLTPQYGLHDALSELTLKPGLHWRQMDPEIRLQFAIETAMHFPDEVEFIVESSAKPSAHHLQVPL
jgi:hypothetical protein